MNKLTLEQAIAITAYTGVSACDFSVFHKDVEKRLGQSVYTHQFANVGFARQVKELYREDFLAMVLE